MKEIKVLVTIMSFNRGLFLKNFIASVQANFEIVYDLLIYDDRSDDQLTLLVLDEYKEFVVGSIIKRAYLKFSD